MDYKIDIKEDVFEVKLGERVTFSDLHGFRKMVQRMVESRSGSNIVDLSDVCFIDSAGLSMLLLARDEVSRTSANLTLRAPREQIRHLFSVSSFDQMFDIEDDETP